MSNFSETSSGNDDRLNFIGGEFVDTANHFDNISPINGQVIGSVAEADEATVDAAVTSARSAVEGEWGRTTGTERFEYLKKIADGIDARFDDLVEAEIADTGRPVEQARTIDIARAAANFRLFANLSAVHGDECFHTDTPDRAGALNYSVRKPLGVVGVISPWNLPLLLMTWKVAPALAAGNAVVAKPSEETPSSASLLAEIIHDAGLPAGTFNLVHGFGPGSAGEFLASHPMVDALTFTGESKTGSTIMKSAADTVKPVSFELGGKNAAIIFEDADIDAAVDGTLRSTFTNCGQVCLCSERVFVQSGIFDEFVKRLAEKARKIVIGRPYDHGTDMGPLISRKHREKVLSFFESARNDGATFVTGGGTPEFGDDRDDGAFVEPTILTGLKDSSRCVTDEIFGPVCHVASFETEEEAIARANNSVYGLAAAVWTDNLKRGHRVARSIEAGIVWVNCWYLRDLRTPFGGVKLSGIGREGGIHSMNFYSEPTNICVKL